MEEIVYHTNYELEDNYWWFVAKFHIVSTMIDKVLKLEPGSNILDVGCGTGGFAAKISNKYQAMGLDTSKLALEYCQKRGLTKLFHMKLDDFPKSEQIIDAITMLDVIEHIDDDLEVLQQARSILKEKGWLVVTVPAYMWLWSKHDEVHMHKRRYTKEKLNSIIQKAGFDIQFSSYFNTFLFPAAALKRIMGKIFGENKSEQPVEPVSPLLNKLFTKVFSSEAKVLPSIPFPFGVSIISIAKVK